MIYLLSIILLISIGVNILLGWGVYRTLKLKEFYDAFFDQLRTQLKSTIDLMNKIDTNGAFESDDEVGDVFKQMYYMIQSLDVFLLTVRSSSNEEENG